MPVTYVGTVVLLGTACMVSTINGNSADVVAGSITVGAVLGIGAMHDVCATLGAGAIAGVGSLSRVVVSNASHFTSAVMEGAVLVLTFDSALERWASFSAIDRTVSEEPGIL